MSRLARSCGDWHQLLEICALFDTLIADVDAFRFFDLTPASTCCTCPIAATRRHSPTC
jgi:hypothetical protein